MNDTPISRSTRAREHGAQMALYVLDQIALSGDADAPTASGGVPRVWMPWDIDAGALTPITYRYVLPPDPEGA